MWAALSVALLCGATGCVPGSDSTRLATALLAAARDSRALDVGPEYCDDCSTSITDARRSPIDPAFAVATLHVAFNSAGDQKTRLVFARRTNRWHVLMDADQACERGRPIPLSVARSLGLCASRS
jgi:hypothetical protein